jgi:hypothetical protein
MRRIMRIVCLVVGVCSAASVSIAQDVLELRNGSIIRGTFMGGSATTVRFETERGILDVFGRDEVLALTFGGGGGSGAAASAPPAQAVAATPAPAPAPAQPARPSQIVVQSGTILLVTLDSTLSTDRTRRDERFSARLTHDLVSNGVVMVPAGTRVFGRVTESRSAGRVAGRPELSLRLRELDINGTLVRIRTNDFSDTGASSFRGTARNAGLGAGVGAAFGGGEGAARGAAIGGATSVLSRGDSITIPAGSILEFRLTDTLVH